MSTLEVRALFSKGITIAIISIVFWTYIGGVGITYLLVDGPEISRSLRNEAHGCLDWPLARPFLVKKIVSSMTADRKEVSDIDAMEKMFDANWLSLIHTDSLPATTNNEPIAALTLSPNDTLVNSEKEFEIEFTVYSLFATPAVKFIVSVSDGSCRVASV